MRGWPPPRARGLWLAPMTVGNLRGEHKVRLALWALPGAGGWVLVGGVSVGGVSVGGVSVGRRAPSAGLWARRASVMHPSSGLGGVCGIMPVLRRRFWV